MEERRTDRESESEWVAPEDDRREEDNPWLAQAAELRNGVLVGAALVASLAFQSIVSPPGGFWQDDLHDVPANAIGRKNHTAGDPIWRDKDLSAHRRYQIINRIAFVLCGLSIMATLCSAFQFKRTFKLFCAFVAFYVAFLLLLVNLIVYAK